MNLFGFMSMAMSNIFERLKEERKRLGLSQGEFAELLSIHRNTQARYERGEREPDTTYLSAISKVGVDIGYVLTGVAEGGKREQEEQIRGYSHVIDFLQGYLGLGKGRLNTEFVEAVQASFEGVRLYWENLGKNLDPERADDKLRAVIRKSPVLILSTQELEDLIERVEFVQGAKSFKLSPQEKASLIIQLYREERETGVKSDYNRVQQAMELVVR